MHEPYRTMLGHLRHEIGHYYWYVLVDEAPLRPVFRALFGDERKSYEAAFCLHATLDDAMRGAQGVSRY